MQHRLAFVYIYICAVAVWVCSYMWSQTGSVHVINTLHGSQNGGGELAPPNSFSEKVMNIVQHYTFVLGAEYFSPPLFACLLHHCTQTNYCLQATAIYTHGTCEARCGYVFLEDYNTAAGSSDYQNIAAGSFMLQYQCCQQWKNS